MIDEGSETDIWAGNAGRARVDAVAAGKALRAVHLVGSLSRSADTRPLETYALEFASLPLCPRDEDAQNRRWYGWKDCTICPACYHEFARGTALAPRMQLKGETAPVSLMCEMYSPRMRALYVEACAKGDPAELLKASRKRRSLGRPRSFISKAARMTSTDSGSFHQPRSGR